jgi:ferric-dicitrate binding protein FerR (iron transport regulator)
MSQIDDLLENLEFIRWVKSPDKELTNFWQSWMDANPNRIQDLKLAKEIISNIHFPAKKPTEGVKKEVLNRILRETTSLELEGNCNGYPVDQNRRNSKLQFSKVAAILVGVLILSFLLLNFTKDQPQQVQTKSTNWLTKTAAVGEKITFRLSDQTIVWLNSGSSLRFPESFDSTVRFVELQGEGFFEVAENQEKPFQVLTDSLLTTALGTSFNINSKNKGILTVSLVTGKVSVNLLSENPSYFLVPGEELKFNKVYKEGDITEFNEEMVLAWRMGKLIFQKSNLDEVIELLENWYGVQIQIIGSPKNTWRFTGKFEKQTLENVLRSISNIENFTYTIDNKEVKFFFYP